MRPHNLFQGAVLVLALSAGVGGGCAADEVLNPLTMAGTGGNSSTTVGSGGSGGQVTPFRTVIERDPMGNVQKTKNLLWDGDFEWRPSFEDQYGWLYGPSEQQLSYALPPLEMGAKCRSGIKCAQLDDGAVLLGLSVAFEAEDLAVSVWSAPEGGFCTDMEIYLLSQDNKESDVTIDPVTPMADADGWCQHSALVPERSSAQYLFIKNHSKSAFVDDASIEPAASAMQVKSAPSSGATLGASRAAVLRRWARGAQLPRIKPPSQGELAFRRHLQRLMR